LLFDNFSPSIKYILFLIGVLPIAISQLMVNIKENFVKRYFIQFYKFIIYFLRNLRFKYLIISYIPNIQLISDENRTILTGGIITVLAIRRFIDDIVKQVELHRILVVEKKEKRKERTRK